jgi:hypothetical protein
MVAVGNEFSSWIAVREVCWRAVIFDVMMFFNDALATAVGFMWLDHFMPQAPPNSHLVSLHF